MEKIDKIKEFLCISYGYGNGYGNGNGNGYGNGNGNGNGDGYGDGYGDGDGYGYGNGVKSYNNQTIWRVDNIPTIILSVHRSYAKAAILNSDLTITPCFIAKRGNYFAHGETLAKARQAAESKYAEHLPIEERIRLFVEAHPNTNPEKRYSAKDFYTWHHTLTGSCEFGRKAFAKEHSVDIDLDTLTVWDFINLTENAYGGDIIKQLKTFYLC